MSLTNENGATADSFLFAEDSNGAQVPLVALAAGFTLRKGADPNKPFVHAEDSDGGQVPVVMIHPDSQTDSGGGIAEAPVDGKQYARQNGAWSEVEASGGGDGTVPDGVVTDTLLFKIHFTGAELDYGALYNGQIPGYVTYGPGGFYLYDGALPYGQLGSIDSVSDVNPIISDATSQLTTFSCAQNRMKNVFFQGAAQPDINSLAGNWAYTTTGQILETRVRFVEANREFPCTGGSGFAASLDDPTDLFCNGAFTLEVYGVILSTSKPVVAPTDPNSPYMMRGGNWVMGSGRIQFNVAPPTEADNATAGTGDYIVDYTGKVWMCADSTTGFVDTGLIFAKNQRPYTMNNSGQDLDAQAGGRYAFDYSQTATVNLPASPLDNDTVDILDCGGKFGTNNLTVNSGATSINTNGTTTFVCNENNKHYRFVFSIAYNTWFVER